MAQSRRATDESRPDTVEIGLGESIPITTRLSPDTMDSPWRATESYRRASTVTSQQTYPGRRISPLDKYPWGRRGRRPGHRNTRGAENTKTSLYKDTVRSSNSMSAISCTEAPQEHVLDWSQGDTAREMSFEMRPGKYAFQKTCRDIRAFVTSAARRQGRKEFLERQISFGFDPANQNKTNIYVVNDVLEELEPHESLPRAEMTSPRTRIKLHLVHCKFLFDYCPR